MPIIFQETQGLARIDHQAGNTSHDPCVRIFYTAAKRIFCRRRPQPKRCLDFSDFDRIETVSVKFTAEPPAAGFPGGPGKPGVGIVYSDPTDHHPSLRPSQRPRNLVIGAMRRKMGSGPFAGPRTSWQVARGLSQSFSDRCASCMRGQHGPTSGYGMVFQTAEFLSMVGFKQAPQSAISLRIVRGKLCDRPVYTADRQAACATVSPTAAIRLAGQLIAAAWPKLAPQVR